MTHVRIYRFRRPLSVALLVALSTLLGAAASEAAPSRRLIPFQARLTDGSGQALTGTQRVTFTIYDAPTGGTRLWGETHEAVSVSDGMVNVLLGSVHNLDDANGDGDPSDPVRFDAGVGPRYLSIKVGVDSNQEMVPRQSLVPAFHARTADAVVPDGVGTAAIQDRAVTAAKIDPGAGVPVGSIIMWWGAKNALPEGFEICDGQLPTTQGALLQYAKPDLRERFPRGALGSQTDVVANKVTGGFASIGELETSGTPLTLAHLPSHNHFFDVTTVSGGAHSHSFQAVPGTGGPCDGSADGAGDRALALGDGNNRPCPDIIRGGAHTHQVFGVTDNSPAGLLAHTHKTPPTENRPPFLDVFYIIRVK